MDDNKVATVSAANMILSNKKIVCDNRKIEQINTDKFL